MANIEGPITLSEEDIRSYSVACVKSLRALNHHQSSKLVCLLRGGYPPTRVVHRLAQEFLECPPELCDIPTSNFLKNRKHLVYALVENLINSYEAHKGGSFTIDTAITGSSSRQFLDDLHKYFRDVIRKKQDRLSEPILRDYVFTRFWHRKEADFNGNHAAPNIFSRTTRDDKGRVHALNLALYNFGVKNLMSEDVPVLLGIDYPIDLKATDNEGVHGQKSEYATTVCRKEPIIVLGNSDERKTYRPSGAENTSDVFIGLLVDCSRDIIDRLAFEFKRKKPCGSTWYPSLVNFCGSLKYR